MRQIVLDTETTGLNPSDGHRIIEIGCVEIIDRRITGKHYHQYLNPERIIDKGAFAVHGLSDAFLADKPLFTQISEAFLEFIRDAELIIHNAPFDIGFLDFELRRAQVKPGKIDKYCQIFDTLVLARTLHPGQKNNLDALCKRYHIDNSHRDLHGALLDARILANLYLVMTGGQGSLFDELDSSHKQHAIHESVIPNVERPRLPVILPSADELIAHENYREQLKKMAETEIAWE